MVTWIKELLDVKCDSCGHTLREHRIVTHTDRMICESVDCDCEEFITNEEKPVSIV